jgi:hypothetical protein
LLPNITGAFDNLLAVSGWSVDKLLPVLISNYTWEGSYLEADMRVRLPSGLRCRCCRAAAGPAAAAAAAVVFPQPTGPTLALIMHSPRRAVCEQEGGRAQHMLRLLSSIPCMLPVQARGLGRIPGFSYRDDAGASYGALLAYANTTLGLFYR